jgi:hypothetical protein
MVDEEKQRQKINRKTDPRKEILTRLITAADVEDDN